MAHVSPRLAVSSIEDPTPPLTITADNWAELERVLGRDLSDDIRAEIVKHGNSYLEWRRFEMQAGSVRDLEKALQPVKEATLAFRRFATREIFASLDAGVELELMMKRSLAELPSRLKSQLIMVLNPETDKWEPLFRDKSAPPTAIAVSFDMFREISNQLSFAVRRVELEIGRQQTNRGGFTPGTSASACRSWLMNMDALFKGRNEGAVGSASKFPFAAFKDGEVPGAYPHFLLALHRLFPEKLQEPVANAEAMAARIKEHRKEGRKAGHPIYQKKKGG